MQCKLTDALKRALLAQTSCNDEALSEFLECEIDFLWAVQHDGCSCRLRYVYTLLGLIEAAQIFSRNKVDQMTRVAQSQSDEKYTAFSVLRGESERDASGRECAWSAATSQQFFNRNSQDETIAFTDYRHKYNSEFKNNGYDKSCRHTTGFGFHMSRVETGHNRQRDMQESTDGLRVSETNGGTGPFLPTLGTKWDPGEGLLFPGIFGTISRSLSPNEPGPLIGEDTLPKPVSAEDFCPEPTIDNPDGECRTNLYPSLGEGYSGRNEFTFGIEVLGTAINIKYSWAEGRNFRQYFHCQGSKVNENRITFVNDVDNASGFTRATEDDNQVYSSERTDIAHLVRKYGITIRRSYTDNDAQETQRARANGVAHSESQRDKQATGYRQERAEAETVRSGASTLRKTESATNDMVSVKYSHISTHLAKLWQRIWDEALLLERQFAAIPAIATMNCIKESSCRCIARQSWACLGRPVPV